MKFYTRYTISLYQLQLFRVISFLKENFYNPYYAEYYESNSRFFFISYNNVLDAERTILKVENKEGKSIV